MARLSPSRILSYDVLVDILTHQKDPATSFESHLANMGEVKRIDRNLAFEIIYGSLRSWGKLYWILQQYSKRNLDNSNEVVKVALVAGTFQIYYLSRVPNRAVVNESAEYARIKKQEAAVPYINGILRQISKKARRFPKPDQQTHPVQYLSTQFSCPEWIVSRWLERFTFDKLEKLLRASCGKPPVTVRLNLLAGPKNPKFHRLIVKHEKSPPYKRPLTGCYQLRRLPDFNSGTLFHEGLITIQDESSQIVGYLVNPQPEDFIVDACAGPGGKITHIYEISAYNHLFGHDQEMAEDAEKEVENQGENHENEPEEFTDQDLEVDDMSGNKNKEDSDADKIHDDRRSANDPNTVIEAFRQNQKTIASDYEASQSNAHHTKPCLPRMVAIEKSSASYQKMMENMTRLRVQGVSCFLDDFLHFQPKTPPNKILLDAPCSGLGVLRRHPEGKLFKKEPIIGRMVSKQRELLIHAVDILAEGGELIYSVCSFELEETREQKDWLLQTYPDRLSVMPLAPRIQGYYKRFITKDQLLMIYSGLSDGMDGFSAFIVKKLS